MNAGSEGVHTLRTIGIILACGLFLAACSGGAASPSAEAPSAAPSLAASAAPSEAPASVEPSIAASVAPSASAATEGCMDPKAHALLLEAQPDYLAIPQEDRDLMADALEAYEFPPGKGLNPEYVAQYAKELRTPGRDIFPDLWPLSLWAGAIVIVPCG